MNLQNLPNVPLPIHVIEGFLEGYKAPLQKVQAMEAKGEITRLKRGLFIKTGQLTNLAFVANHIYCPSYVSREYALRHYGLIPEHAHTVTSVTVKRSQTFENSLGRFTYDHLPLEYYRLGIELVEEEGISYLIATPEKALADMIVLTSGLRLRYLKETESYLEDFLRIDREELQKLNPERFEELAQVSKKRDTLLNIAKIIRQ
ncbi:MAG: hypothetical protein HUK11_01470 [Muribaculaceae bacterium]|nr:hypothetical protein [Muribaculaceae bacterium]